MKSLRYHYSNQNTKHEILKDDDTEFIHSCSQALVEIERKKNKYSKIVQKIKNEDSDTSISKLPKKSSKSINLTAYAHETFESFRESLGITNDAYINVRMSSNFTKRLEIVSRFVDSPHKLLNYLRQIFNF